MRRVATRTIAPMRLGLTDSTYQWLFARPGGPRPGRDTLEYNLLGQPTPYFGQTPPRIDPGEKVEWLIAKCVALGLPVLHAMITRWDDRGHLDRVKSLLEQHDMELIPAVGANLISSGDTQKQAIEGAQQMIRRYQEFGGVR